MCACMIRRTHTHVRIYTRTHLQAHPRTHTHARTHTYLHLHMYTHIRAHAVSTLISCPCRSIYKHLRAHTHTHFYMQVEDLKFLVTAMGGTVSLSPPSLPEGAPLPSFPEGRGATTVGQESSSPPSGGGHGAAGAGISNRVVLVGKFHVKAGVGPLLSAMARGCGPADEDGGVVDGEVR